MNYANLISKFEELYLIEKKAHDLYQELMHNEKLSLHEQEIIHKIHDDEEKHMIIAREIIDLLKNEEGRT